MKDYICLGSAPWGEDCVQVRSDRPYIDEMRAENRRYIQMLQKRFAGLLEVSGVRLAIKSFPHDFGSYCEVCAIYDDDNEKQSEIAYFLEGACPESWDDEQVFDKIPEKKQEEA